MTTPSLARRICVSLAATALGVWGAVATAQAAPSLHMSFHMALVKDSERKIGATLVNRGDENIAHGYAVVTLIDAQCKPFTSVMASFGNISPGEKLSVNIPVSASFHSYRLASLAAFDEEGFVVPAIDDNLEILKAREPEERNYCAEAKGKNPL